MIIFCLSFYGWSVCTYFHVVVCFFSWIDWADEVIITWPLRFFKHGLRFLEAQLIGTDIVLAFTITLNILNVVKEIERTGRYTIFFTSLNHNYHRRVGISSMNELWKLLTEYEKISTIGLDQVYPSSLRSQDDDSFQISQFDIASKTLPHVNSAPLGNLILKMWYMQLDQVSRMTQLQLFFLVPYHKRVNSQILMMCSSHPSLSDLECYIDLGLVLEPVRPKTYLSVWISLSSLDSVEKS